MRYSKVSPRPWTYRKGIEVQDSEGRNILMPGTIENIECDLWYPNNLSHIVKCVNQHDKLVEKTKKLKQDLNIMLEQEEKRQGFTDAVMDENNKLNLENNRLREALQMCSPFIPKKDAYNCSFCTCGNEHADDCEYIRLTEDEE